MASIDGLSHDDETPGIEPMQMQKKNGRAEQKTTKDEEGPHRSDTNRLVALSFIRPLLTEAVIGYVFWTVVHALPAMVWFFPLQVMEISGYEAVGVIWVISPLLCGIGPLFRFLQTKYGLLLLRLGLVCSLASFQFSNIIIRLLVLTAGNMCAVLLLCASWFSMSAYQRSVSFWGFMLGYMALLSSRIWYVSLTPAWADHPSNQFIIALGIIATLERLTAYEYQWPVTNTLSEKTPHWILCGLSFGSLLFVTHFLYGEVSVACRLVVSGHPHPGPSPNPWGAAILMELATGFLISCKKNLADNFLFWWFVGCHSIAGLLYFTNYLGLMFAIFLALYVTAVWPEVSDRLSSSPVVRTTVLAFTIYLAMQLACVWVTAYNFVPLGWVTRERTYILLTFIIGVIGLGLGRGDAKDHDDKSATHIAFTDIDGTGPYSVYADFKILLALVTLIGIGGFVPRFMSEQFIAEPQKSDPKTFSTMMWSVRFMYDNNGWPSFDRAATVLNNTEADFISFLESDASKPFLGNNDITMWMSEKLGMYSDFGPSTASHTWGSNLFSKYQIVRSSHHILPSPHGELGPAIFATVNISGTLVDLLTAHNGNYEDSLDRKLQTEYIANITRNSTNPLVYMGYVTSKPGERDYKQLTTRGRLKDIDETDRKRFCLYIMYRGLIRVGYARISHGGLTDTEIQLAKFRIPDNPNKYQDNNYITIQSEDVDPSVRFPTVFGKHYHTHWWGKGNYYHMNTPKYFIKRKPGA